jgi:VIT1/CCC1 family predicted Fe2+/Mn2+ transporter
MKKVIYGIALLMAIVTFLICLFNEISLMVGIFRSVVVFLGVLFVFSIAGHLLSWGIMITGKKANNTINVDK